MPITILRSSIGSTGSTALLRAAEQAATELGAAVAIAVVDDSGALKGFSRMDGAPLLSSDIARDKAVTAASFGVATHLWYDQIKDEPALVHGLGNASGFTLLGGGVPVRANGAVIGGIGVSGGSAEEDLAIAEAALKALDEL